jgi:hypothetical protein
MGRSSKQARFVVTAALKPAPASVYSPITRPGCRFNGNMALELFWEHGWGLVDVVLPCDSKFAHLGLERRSLKSQFRCRPADSRDDAPAFPQHPNDVLPLGGM